MGVDKAEMCLGGRTLLEIAIGKLQSLASEVVVVGQRQAVPDGLRVIADLRPGCGPMGGMEAALLDLNAGSGVENGSAVFLPVDMPFLPAGLLARMVGAWAKSETSVCMAVADGRVQPLVSLVRAEIIADVRAALHQGSYKLRPMLEEAGRARSGLVCTEILTAERGSVWPGWMPDDAEWAARELWFANLNTPEEFALAERFGSAGRPMLNSGHRGSGDAPGLCSRIDGRE